MYKGIDFVKLPAQIWAIISAVCMIITNIIGIGTPEVTPGLELVKTDKVILEEAMYTGQGITTDGEYYYTSGSMTGVKMNGLSKRNVSDFSVVKTKLGAIPEQYVEEHGSNHIGGISYYNGLIYAAVENGPDDFPLVITYDCETLEAVDVYEMPLEMLPNGIPWCAVDAENGLLYCSPFRNVEAIPAFDLETLEFVRYIPLSQTVTRVQGGEVYEGKLYLSCDDGDNTDTIYSVDVASGETKLFAERKLPGLAGNECEDLTVFPMEDGTLFHVLDYDKSMCVYLHHYKLTEK